MTVTKADIIDSVYRGDFAGTKKDAFRSVDMVFRIIKEALGLGEQVKVAGFGQFCLKDKLARRGRDPVRGTPLAIPPRRVLNFRPSAVLKEDVMSRYGGRLLDDGGENTARPPEAGTRKALGHFTDDGLAVGEPGRA